MPLWTELMSRFTAGTAPVKVPVASPVLFLISC